MTNVSIMYCEGKNRLGTLDKRGTKKLKQGHQAMVDADGALHVGSRASEGLTRLEAVKTLAMKH